MLRAPVRLLLVASIVCATCLLLASGCANPTTAYHRQFDYLRRVGGEALAEGRHAEAREHLSEAAKLAKIAAATDLELVDVLTHLSAASRRVGSLEEARRHLETAARVLARYRLAKGNGGGALRDVGGACALERARVETARGDFEAAEHAAREFFDLRGAGGDVAEAAEVHGLLAELLLARGLVGEAQAELRAAESGARRLDAASGGRLLLRVAEVEIEQGWLDRARTLVEATRPDGAGPAALRPGMLLVLARIDVAERNFERAEVRLDEALALLESGDPAILEDPASPARAVFVASLLFDVQREHASLIAAMRRSAALAGSSQPLARLHLGNALVNVGRALIRGGRRADGAKTIRAGRAAVASALGGRQHVALVRADFEMANAYAALGRGELASERCDGLLEMSKRLEEIGHVERVERLIACGRIDAELQRVGRARKRFLDALYSDGAPLDARLRLELLVRLAALSHVQDGDSAETKFFERVLPLAGGAFDRLEELLIDAYGPFGSAEPSSAAARIAHVAARSTTWYSAAPELQAMAQELGERVPGAASLR